MAGGDGKVEVVWEEVVEGEEVGELVEEEKVWQRRWWGDNGEG